MLIPPILAQNPPQSSEAYLALIAALAASIPVVFKGISLILEAVAKRINVNTEAKQKQLTLFDAIKAENEQLKQEQITDRATIAAQRSTLDERDIENKQRKEANERLIQRNEELQQAFSDLEDELEGYRRVSQGSGTVENENVYIENLRDEETDL